MSELIVRMEPPKLCFECFFRLDCELYMNEVMKPFGNRDFTAFKPLVNGCLIHGVLPEKHGDLIDRDELLKCKGDCYDFDGHLLYAVGTGTILRMKTVIAATERSET